MRRSVGSLLLLSSWLCLSAPASAQTLFFSEYIEGSGNNKALEIYNASPGSIDLSNVQVETYLNGSISPTVIQLDSVLVAASDVFVIANPGIDASVLAEVDQTSGSINFNGDDALVLRQDGEIVDSIGRVGEDPGTAWSGGGVSTQNQTLRRTTYACGVSDPSDPFDPSDEWQSFGLDDLSDLGNEDGLIDLQGCQAAAVPSLSIRMGVLLLASLLALALRRSRAATLAP